MLAKTSGLKRNIRKWVLETCYRFLVRHVSWSYENNETRAQGKKHFLKYHSFTFFLCIGIARAMPRAHLHFVYCWAQTYEGGQRTAAFRRVMQGHASPTTKKEFWTCLVLNMGLRKKWPQKKIKNDTQSFRHPEQLMPIGTLLTAYGICTLTPLLCPTTRLWPLVLFRLKWLCEWACLGEDWLCYWLSQLRVRWRMRNHALRRSKGKEPHLAEACWLRS